MTRINKALDLAKEITEFTENEVLPLVSGDLNIRRKKGAQLRLFGVGYSIHKNISLLLIRRSIIEAEALLRPLVEAVINFGWIGIGPGSRNYYLFVIDDNRRMEKISQEIINFELHTGGKKEIIDEWISTIKINQKQAEECIKTSKFIQKNDRCPTLLERTKQLDSSLELNEHGYEWLYRYIYSFGHHVIHVSNRQINMLINDATQEIELLGNDNNCAIVQEYANAIYLDMLDGFVKSFRLKLDLSTFWPKIETQ